jgi:hypothetical protein
MMSAEEARTEGTVVTEELKTSCDVRGRLFFKKDRLDTFILAAATLHVHAAPKVRADRIQIPAAKH